MASHVIERRPTRAGAVTLLESAALPTADLTDAHMEHFFYCGPAETPSGLVGLEFCGEDALLRSLAVTPNHRASGLGSALVDHAEAHARARGARAIFLLTTTAEEFFKRRGYARAERASAPEAIQQAREFAEICPASSAFLVKALRD
jgi:amino-acid N-acetyltransferase